MGEIAAGSLWLAGAPLSEVVCRTTCVAQDRCGTAARRPMPVSDQRITHHLRHFIFERDGHRLAGLRPFGYMRSGRRLFPTGSARIVYGEHALDSYWRLAGALPTTPPPPDRVHLRVSGGGCGRDALAKGAGVRLVTSCWCRSLAAPLKSSTKSGRVSLRTGATAAGSIPIRGSRHRDGTRPDEMDAARAVCPQAKLLENSILPLRRAARRCADDRQRHRARSHGGVGPAASCSAMLGPTRIEQWGPRGPGLNRAALSGMAVGGRGRGTERWSCCPLSATFVPSYAGARMPSISGYQVPSVTM